ncbi:hypothetical protein B0H13DRAFT_1935189 [Mycena leptocephala]|nr:hypothetical protein B0H13DRAFT_1935189 [Mycena leptocephala]
MQKREQLRRTNSGGRGRGRWQGEAEAKVEAKTEVEQLIEAWREIGDGGRTRNENRHSEVTCLLRLSHERKQGLRRIARGLSGARAREDGPKLAGGVAFVDLGFTPEDPRGVRRRARRGCSADAGKGDDVRSSLKAMRTRNGERTQPAIARCSSFSRPLFPLPPRNGHLIDPRAPRVRGADGARVRQTLRIGPLVSLLHGSGDGWRVGGQ